MLDQLPHVFNDDACCIYCGFDGAEDWWLRQKLRLEIGDDEFNYLKSQGEFDAERFCQKRAESEIGEYEHEKAN